MKIYKNKIKYVTNNRWHISADKKIQGIAANIILTEKSLYGHTPPHYECLAMHMFLNQGGFSIYKNLQIEYVQKPDNKDEMICLGWNWNANNAGMNWD